jgi:hypothetical protein
MTENESFLKKHKPLTPEEVKRQFAEKEAAKKQYVTDAAILEKEIDSFNKLSDPLVNPTTGKALCWIRRPTQGEWESMLPTEILKYRNDPNGIPTEVSSKYQDLTFDLMERIIETPKHDAKWWKEHANLLFMQLFQMHLNQLMNELGMMAENF